MRILVQSGGRNSDGQEAKQKINDDINNAHIPAFFHGGRHQ